MTLLREIQNDALNSTVDLADLLRKCKVLAVRLKHQEFAEWINRELNGYGETNAVPDYRVVATTSLGHFSGAFGRTLKNAPIPTLLLPTQFRKVATEQRFAESVGTLAARIPKDKSDGSLSGKWPADLIAYLQHNVQMYEDMVLLDAWRVISVASVKGILDTVRTRVLDFALAIEEREPTAGDALPGEAPRLASEAVTNIFNTVIHGGQANIGTSGDASIGGKITFSAAVPKGKRAAIESALRKLKDELASVSEPEDRAEASAALVKVEQQLESATPRVDRIKKYLELYATIVTVASPTIETLQKLLHAVFGP